MMELYHNSFTKFCHVNNFEELEMDTDSLYVALVEKDWRTVYDLIWKQIGSNCSR